MNLKTTRKETGITLIALVITIIVLLILAAVTIGALTGDNGILSNAAKAKEETEKAEIIEQIRLELYGEMASNNGVEPTDADIERIASEYGKVEGNTFDDKILKTNEGNYEIKLSDIWTPTSFEPLQPGETATAGKNKYESDGKVATIPEGFTVSNVPGETTINGGLVIYCIPEGTDTSEDFWTGQDSEGIYNVQKEYDQYVWIPVDGIIGEDGNIDDVNAENIKDRKILLGRYNFANDGTPSVYSGRYTEDTQESHNADYENAIAEDIEGFIQSVRDNDGYYIARYEAGVTGYDADNVQTSNSEGNPDWTGYSGEDMKLVTRRDVQPWNYITQNRAANLSREIDNSYTKSNVTSDLINSYAWDTAILFIQKYSGDTNYSRQDGYSTTPSQLANTGEGKIADTKDLDNPCNIYDMAGNCYEWTTETCTSSSYPCVVRGSAYDSSSTYTSLRPYNNTTYANTNYSFRSLLYL